MRAAPWDIFRVERAGTPRFKSILEAGNTPDLTTAKRSGSAFVAVRIGISLLDDGSA